jgi:hypothetical protein
VARAIKLDLLHAQALQILGGLLMDFPWILGGEERKSQVFLE